MQPCFDDRETIAEIVAGCELEIGDAKSERDQARQGERSCKAARDRDAFIPFIAGGTSGVVGTALGIAIGFVAASADPRGTH